MKNLKKISLFFLFSTLILSTLLLLTGQADAELKFGGVLRYAMIDSPPTLDQHAVTSDLSTTIAQRPAQFQVRRNSGAATARPDLSPVFR